jgi:hypothetical protein
VILPSQLVVAYEHPDSKPGDLPHCAVLAPGHLLRNSNILNGLTHEEKQRVIDNMRITLSRRNTSDSSNALVNVGVLTESSLRKPLPPIQSPRGRKSSRAREMVSAALASPSSNSGSPKLTRPNEPGTVTVTNPTLAPPASNKQGQLRQQRQQQKQQEQPPPPPPPPPQQQQQQQSPQPMQDQQPQRDLQPIFENQIPPPNNMPVHKGYNYLTLNQLRNEAYVFSKKKYECWAVVVRCSNVQMSRSEDMYLSVEVVDNSLISVGPDRESASVMIFASAEYRCVHAFIHSLVLTHFS